MSVCSVKWGQRRQTREKKKQPTTERTFLPWTPKYVNGGRLQPAGGERPGRPRPLGCGASMSNDEQQLVKMEHLFTPTHVICRARAFSHTHTSMRVCTLCTPVHMVTSPLSSSSPPACKWLSPRRKGQAEAEHSCTRPRAHKPTRAPKPRNAASSRRPIWKTPVPSSRDPPTNNCIYCYTAEGERLRKRKTQGGGTHAIWVRPMAGGGEARGGKTNNKPRKP